MAPDDSLSAVRTHAGDCVMVGEVQRLDPRTLVDGDVVLATVVPRWAAVDSPLVLGVYRQRRDRSDPAFSVPRDVWLEDGTEPRGGRRIDGIVLHVVGRVRHTLRAIRRPAGRG